LCCTEVGQKEYSTMQTAVVKKTKVEYGSNTNGTFGESIYQGVSLLP
jgi:hypothetical protein